VEAGGGAAGGRRGEGNDAGVLQKGGKATVSMKEGTDRIGDAEKEKLEK
jgi:hypothetical protein